MSVLETDLVDYIYLDDGDETPGSGGLRPADVAPA